MNDSPKVRASMRRLRAAFLLSIWLFGFIPRQAIAAPVPTGKRADYPNWWFEREVIKRLDPNETGPSWPSSYPGADDYAVINQGQIKHLATKAAEELEVSLPGGAGDKVKAAVSAFQVIDCTRQPGVSAKQSSTVLNGDALRAIDGNKSGDYGSGSVTHTDHELNPWWQVDLGRARTIQHVKLWNRTDCCGERLANVRVFVASFDMSDKSISELMDTDEVWRSELIADPDLPLALGAVSGQYVRVQIEGEAMLSLAEVEVWGNAAPGRMSPDDHSVLTLGQMKELARPFYRRLIDIGFIDKYPWLHEGALATNDALANLGQAKNLFSFDPGGDLDGDGYSNLFEILAGGDLSSGDNELGEFSIVPATHGLVPIYLNPKVGRSPASTGYAGGGGVPVPAAIGPPLYSLTTDLNRYCDKLYVTADPQVPGSSFYVVEIGIPIWDQRANTLYEIQVKDGDLGAWATQSVVRANELGNGPPGYDGFRIWTANLQGGRRYEFRVYASNDHGRVLIRKNILGEVPLDVNAIEEFAPGGGNRTGFYFTHSYTGGAGYSYRVLSQDRMSGSTIIHNSGQINLSGTSSNTLPMPPSDEVNYFVVPNIGLKGTDHRPLLNQDFSLQARAMNSDGESAKGTALLLFADSGAREVSIKVNPFIDHRVLPAGVTYTYDESKLVLVTESGSVVQSGIAYSDVGAMFVQNKNLAHQETATVDATFDYGEDYSFTDQVKIFYSAFKRDGGLPGSRRVPTDEASGPRFRKVALNGRPVADRPPEDTPESDQQAEETFVDALNLSLHHSVTDIWSCLPGSDLPLAVRRNLKAETWSTRHGLQPRDFLFRAFGPCWNSSLDAHVRVVTSPSSPEEAYVHDLNGAIHRFIRTTGTEGQGWICVPTGAHEQQGHKSSFQYAPEDGDEGVVPRWRFEGPNGTTLCFEQVTTVVAAPVPENVTHHTYFRLLWAKDRLGYRLIYVYDDEDGTKRTIPSRVYCEQAPQRALIIESNEWNRVVNVWDPNGNKVVYSYSGAVPSLERVTTAGEIKAIYGYDEKLEPDWRAVNGQLLPGEDPDPHYHKNLSSLMNGRGKQHVFHYLLDTSRKDYDQRGFTYPRVGSPRVVEKIELPGCEEPSFFYNDSNVQIAYSRDEGTGLYKPSLAGLRKTRVVDTEKNEVGFEFDEAEVLRFVDPGATDMGTATNVVSYLRMRVRSEAGVETFRFNPEAALALSETIDLSGNRTTYEYADPIANPKTVFNYCLKTWMNTEGVVTHVVDASTFFSRHSDPTLRVQYVPNDSGAVVEFKTSYLYRRDFDGAPGISSLLSRVDDAEGRRTEFRFDDLGRRVGVSLFEANAGTATQRTEFDYKNNEFPGFVTQKRLLRKATDPAEASHDLVISYRPDINGFLASETTGNVSVLYVNDRNGNRLATINGNKARTSFSYDGQNRLVEIGYPFPATQLVETAHTSPIRTEFTYDAAGNRKTERDERGSVVEREYDDLNRLTSETRQSDAGPVTTRFGYNDVGTKILETDPRGTDTEFVPDGIQRIRFVKAASNRLGAVRTTEHVYGPGAGGSVFAPQDSKATTIINPRDFRTEREYDAAGRMVEERVEYRKAIADVVVGWASKSWVYDRVGNVKEERDSNNNCTKYDYDASNRRVRTTFADETTIETSYSGTGLAYAVKDQRNHVTRTAYDNRGLVTAITSPAFNALDAQGSPAVSHIVTQFSYDGEGNVVEKRMSPAGRAWTFLYDPRNRKVAEIQPMVEIRVGDELISTNPVFRWEYDAVGNLIASVDAMSHRTEMDHDASNRQTEVRPPSVPCVLPDGILADRIPWVKKRYDLNGNIEEVENAEPGRLVLNEYSYHNELKATTDGTGIRTEFDFDRSGNHILVRDGENRVTNLMYDGLSRNIQITYGGVDTVRFIYDGVNKIERIDGKNESTFYSYDALNRLDQVFYEEKDADHLAYNYDYDDSGNVTLVEDVRQGEVGIVEYRYNSAGHLTAERSSNVWHEYAYDEAGRRVRSTFGGHRSVDMAYDALDRVVDSWEAIAPAAWRGGSRTRYGFDANGRGVWQALPNGVNSVTNFDAVGKISNLRNVRLSTNGTQHVISSSEYRYDQTGNVRRVEEERGSDLGGVLGSVTEMKYDYGDRLVEEKRTVGGANVTTTTYVYDDAGNRTGRTLGVAPNLVQRIYTYNDLNQLTMVHDHETQAVTSYEYDENGNRESRSIAAGINTPASQTTYIWGEENRLQGVEELGAGGGSWQYEYDYRSRRTGISDTTNGSNKRFVFSGGLSCQEWSWESTGAGENPSSEWVLNAEYIRGADKGGGVGGLLCSIRPGNVRYSHYNGRGDVVTQTNSFGAATWQASYEGFGRRVAESGTSADPQKANTKDEDPTGLLNEGFRYRDLETGTFLTRDPAGFVDGPNLYAYVRQNPWSKFDPEGLSAFKVGERVKELGGRLVQGGRRVQNWRFRGKDVKMGDLIDANRKINPDLANKLSKRYGSDFSMTYRDDASLDVEKTARRIAERNGAIKAKQFYYGSVNLGEFKGTNGGDLEAAWTKLAEEKKLTPKQIDNLKMRYTPHHDTENGLIQFVDSDAHGVFRHYGGNAAHEAGLYNGIGAGLGSAVIPGAMSGEGVIGKAKGLLGDIGQVLDPGISTAIEYYDRNIAGWYDSVWRSIEGDTYDPERNPHRKEK